jgi:hypothetical protein
MEPAPGSPAKFGYDLSKNLNGSRDFANDSFASLLIPAQERRSRMLACRWLGAGPEIAKR